MLGQLFTHYFLSDGIRATAAWKTLCRLSGFAGFRDKLAHTYDTFTHYTQPNEATTEQELIRPLLELLGWVDYLPQQGAARNEDIPDHLLFADADAKARAGMSNQGYTAATALEESKRFGLPLDARDRNDRVQASSPHGQILRYLATADIESSGRLRWGILTNGRVWRLYDYRARPRASGYYETDLAKLLQTNDEDGLRAFYLLFGRDSFTLQAGATTTFLEDALEEGRRYEEKVAQDLSGVVLEIYQPLVTAIADASKAHLQEVRQAALIFLYRLLFLLYAEDRGLLPVNNPRYIHYGLRKRVRDDIARRIEDGTTFSARASNYYDHLTTLFNLIEEGDASIGLPPYNGGLFASSAAGLLEQVRLADASIAPLIYKLSHTLDERNSLRRFVNYRDMSVQQLGSIYERLLEQELSRKADGSIVVRPSPYARKDSGSFFTPQELVDLLFEHTLKPLVEERRKLFEEKATELKSDRRPKEQRKAELLKTDPAEAVLNLKVLDPAMGSGHFLVTAVDFLSDSIADLIEYAPDVPGWLEGDYVSPLQERVATIRQEILQRAQRCNWIIDEAQLTDQAIIRRLVLKRCIYGVDKNPLTVELAKVSLWLHSFTVGAPLSFLDHHLRCGDSLVGLQVYDAIEELTRLGGLFAQSAIAGAEAASQGMQRIEEMSDADVAEVQESAVLFRGVEETTADLRGLLDFLCGLRWLTAGMKKRERSDYEASLIETLNKQPQQAYQLLVNGPSRIPGGLSESGVSLPPPFDFAIGLSGGNRNGDYQDDVVACLADSSRPDFAKLWDQARAIAAREGFFHWEVAFPGVWHGWQDMQPPGGFDVVIGNPPWDRIKLQEVEWFATRFPQLALAPTAAARRRGIAVLRDSDHPLAAEFDAAKQRADKLGQVVRGSGHYPLLSSGDINLYSLFVERAMRLVKPDGIIGLLTPAGIYANKTAARFFQSVSTTGRVAGLFDFENKKIFFKDVHASFKFCALIFGGRQFKETLCAFFLHDTETIDDPERCFPLTPADFARVNPNTGTAPVFRSRRDADIIRRIYEHHPVLVDHSGNQEQRAWPVSYMNMFHMTNDSHLFRSAAQLDDEGFYPVAGNRWQRGDVLYLPLYQGRMIWQFDHRANSVRINPQNIHNPYLSEAVSEEQHTDPSFLPQSQYWVPAAAVERRLPQSHGWALGFRDITNTTDLRTCVAAIVPLSLTMAGAGNTLSLLLTDDPVAATCLLANLNAMCLDFVARCKMQSTHLSLYILEQFPVIASDSYARRFGPLTAAELVRDHVLRLTYTSHDMAPFAQALGYDGGPFVWDVEARRHLRARLDALYFHLYGLSREDAGYVLGTFSIVRRQDEAEFGSYRTRELVLAYMNALAAGDVEMVVDV